MQISYRRANPADPRKGSKSPTPVNGEAKFSLNGHHVVVCETPLIIASHIGAGTDRGHVTYRGVADGGHQVKLEGKLTVWSAQYDPLSMQPVSARGYELASLSGGESVSALRFLFTLRPVTPEITAAIDAGMAWFAAHEIPGNAGGWARFYDLHTQQPFFPGKRDGKAWTSEEAMRKVNPGGYDFAVKKPRDLPKWHKKWLQALAKEQKGKSSR